MRSVRSILVAFSTCTRPSSGGLNAPVPSSPPSSRQVRPSVRGWQTASSASPRAVTDGAFRVYVEDVVVAPDGRHAWLGRSLVARLLECGPPTAATSLFCSRDLTDFYAELGFHPTGQLVMHHEPDM